MLTHLPRLAALLALAALAACATPADPQQMVAVPKPGSSAFPAPLSGGMCVGSVTGGVDTNPLWVSQVGNNEFRQALERSLAMHGLLAGSAPCRWQVDANLLGLSQPVVGLDLEVTSHINYTAAGPGQPPFLATTVSAPYTATFSDHAIAVVRLKLANEGSIRRNIQIFLDQLRASRPQPQAPR